MRFALNRLAVVAPQWLLLQSEDSWIERYAHRMEESRLPKSEADRQALAEQIGADGRKLLTAVFAQEAPVWLHEIGAAQIFHQIWVQNYCVEEEQLRWREAENLPPAILFINSPYEPASSPGQKAHYLVDGIQNPSHQNL
jgi:transposase